MAFYLISPRLAHISRYCWFVSRHLWEGKEITGIKLSDFKEDARVCAVCWKDGEKHMNFLF